MSAELNLPELKHAVLWKLTIDLGPLGERVEFGPGCLGVEFRPVVVRPEQAPLLLRLCRSKQVSMLLEEEVVVRDVRQFMRDCVLIGVNVEYRSIQQDCESCLRVA